jgi:hypothetical protein
MRFSVTGMTTAVTAPRKGVTDFGYMLGCYGIMDIKHRLYSHPNSLVNYQPHSRNQ